MPNESPGRDPKEIWQNQPTEKPTMTLKLIRQRARELHAKTRSKLLGTLAGPLFVLLFSVFEINGFPLLKPVSWSDSVTSYAEFWCGPSDQCYWQSAHSFWCWRRLGVEAAESSRMPSLF